MRTKELPLHVHYSYRRVHVLLQREGLKDNHKRVYRLYREEGLSWRFKHPKHNKLARLRQPRHHVTAINQIWSMDFVADALFDCRLPRALTVVDKLYVGEPGHRGGPEPERRRCHEHAQSHAAKRGLPGTALSRSITAVNSFPRPWTNGLMSTH